MHNKFYHLMFSLCPDFTNGQIADFWQTIYQYYHEPHRYYHTLHHIQSMLQLFDNIQQNLQSPETVLLAIFYHDIIYQPTKTDNEQQSANVLYQTLCPYIADDILQKACQLILLTHKHELIHDDNDASYFLDMDLAILASTPRIYQQYAKNIRQEYHHVSNSLYQQARCFILQNFLQRQRLYFTDYFYQRLEKQARENLQHEIYSLKNIM